MDVILDTETFDTANLHSTTTNNHQLTAPVAGVYQITGNIRWESNAAGSRFVDITATGAGRIASVWDVAVSGNPTDQSISAAFPLNAGNTVHLEVFQNSGANLDLLKNGTDDPNLSMVWIGPTTAGAQACHRASRSTSSNEAEAPEAPSLGASGHAISDV